MMIQWSKFQLRAIMYIPSSSIFNPWNQQAKFKNRYFRQIANFRFRSKNCFVTLQILYKHIYKEKSEHKLQFDFVRILSKLPVLANEAMDFLICNRSNCYFIVDMATPFKFNNAKIQEIRVYMTSFIKFMFYSKDRTKKILYKHKL